MEINSLTIMLQQVNENIPFVNNSRANRCRNCKDKLGKAGYPIHAPGNADRYREERKKGSSPCGLQPLQLRQ